MKIYLLISNYFIAVVKKSTIYDKNHAKFKTVRFFETPTPLREINSVHAGTDIIWRLLHINTVDRSLLVLSRLKYIFSRVPRNRVRHAHHVGRWRVIVVRVRQDEKKKGRHFKRDSKSELFALFCVYIVHCYYYCYYNCYTLSVGVYSDILFDSRLQHEAKCYDASAALWAFPFSVRLARAFSRMTLFRRAFRDYDVCPSSCTDHGQNKRACMW